VIGDESEAGDCSRFRQRMSYTQFVVIFLKRYYETMVNILTARTDDRYDPSGPSRQTTMIDVPAIV